MTVPRAIPGFDLLRLRGVAAVVRSRAFPGALQVLMLGMLVALAVIGWGRFAPTGVDSKLYAKANLVNLVLWGLWWPALVWVTFLLGRVWCVVCPLEWVSGQARNGAQRLGIHGRPLAAWMKWGGVAVVLFAVLQLLVPGVQLHRVPHYTALFLVGGVLLAAVVGVWFQPRAFCRGFCPVSLLLGVYGRGGMVAVRPASPGNPAAPNARACPSLLNPAELNSSQDCLCCGSCLKADKAGTMRLLLRRPWSWADTRQRLASWPVTLFVICVSGFVTYELAGVWKAAGNVFLWAPRQVNAGGAAGWVQGLWTIVVWPGLLWLALGGLTLLLRGATNLFDAWRRLALPVAVVIATGHMAKGLEKFTSWVGYLPLAWAEPGGVQTATQIQSKLVAPPAPWLSAPALSMLAILLIVLGTGLALREARLAEPEGAIRRFPPILLVGGLYLFLVCGWA